MDPLAKGFALSKGPPYEIGKLLPGEPLDIRDPPRQLSP